ncbi:MAG: CIA30 family protein [Candidatus Anstonellales archaeon]
MKKLIAAICSMAVAVALHSAVLDNFEDGDNGNWWGGFWYTFDDSENGGDSVVNPLPDAKGGIGFIPSDVTDQTNNFYAGRMWGTLGSGYQYAFVGMGTNLGQSGSLPAPVNISGYTGVRFKVKGNNKTYQFKIVDPNQATRNYKVYLKTFTAGSSWQTITVNFNDTDLAYGWGNYNNKTNPTAADWNDKPPLSQVLQGVEAFQWQTVDQTAGTQVDLWVDDVELIDSGSTLPTKPTSTQTGLIDDLEDGDAANTLSGYWYTFNDSERGGNTQVNPPQGTDFTPTSGGAGGSSYCAKFSWTIANPTYSEPFGALGTNLTPDGPPSVADATNTQGIRITYKSTAHHILKITVNDPTISSDPNGVPYQVGLPPAANWTTVTFGWDEFVIPAWFMQENNKAGVDAMNTLKLSTRLNKVMQVHFQSAPVRYKNGGTGEFYVDDVMTVGGSIAGGGGGTQNYTLTVQIVGNGSVTKNPDQTSYAAGTQVTLTAVPGSGATFVGWSGAATGTTNPITITMDSNKTITATFSGGQTQTYTLTVNVSPTGAGTVSKSPDQTSYTAGTNVTLTATPASGYAFVNWTEGTQVLGTAATLQITMTSNRTITANFQQVQAGNYTLTVLINPAGAGTVTKNPNQTSYTAGTQVTLTAQANSGYTFLNWSGDASGTTPTITITMNSNKTVTANFQATGGGGGGGGTTTGKLTVNDNPLTAGQTTVFKNLKSGEVIKVYNLLGEEVASLKEQNGQATWDGKDKNGKLLDSGIYIYKGDKSGTSGKLIIVK